MLLSAVPTLFAVSVLPGLCMTLSMTMGMTIGVKRTLWMMTGELAGLALVATLSIVGIVALTANHPWLNMAARYADGCYLAYVGLGLWIDRQPPADESGRPARAMMTRRALAAHGFVAAVYNPRAWILYVALLLSFIVPALPFVPQLALLVVLLLVIEFACLVAYACGGHTMKLALQRGAFVRMVNLLAGAMILFVAVRLLLLG